MDDEMEGGGGEAPREDEKCRPVQTLSKIL
jgi:hypothetical protein